MLNIFKAFDMLRKLIFFKYLIVEFNLISLFHIKRWLHLFVNGKSSQDGAVYAGVPSVTVLLNQIFSRYILMILVMMLSGMLLSVLVILLSTLKVVLGLWFVATG